MDTVSSKTIRDRFPLRIYGISMALLAADVVAVMCGSYLAFLLRKTIPFFENENTLDGYLWVIASAIALLWVLISTAHGAYAARMLNHGHEIYRSIINSTFITAGAVGVISYLLKFPLSRSFFVVLFLLVPALMLVSRFVGRRILHRLHRKGVGVYRVVLIGDSNHVHDIAKSLAREGWLGYHVVGFLTPDSCGDVSFNCEELGDVRCLGSVDELTDVIYDLDPQILIFTEGAADTTTDFRRTAWELEDRGVDVIVVPAMTDISSDRMELRPVAGLPLVHLELPRALTASRWTKRAFDIVSASVILLILSPVLLAIAVVIKLWDGGPVFFKQIRVGKDGREFGCYKFRSMVPDAEARLEKLSKEAQDKGNLVMFKMADDPRITKPGKYLRRFSLDEFPQLLNVIKGEMSLVGPRPALPKEVALYDDIARRRLAVRPGMTGLWQVSGRSDLSWNETVRLDLYYVDNWSFVRDLAILMKTAQAMVSSRGAY